MLPRSLIALLLQALIVLPPSTHAQPQSASSSATPPIPSPSSILPRPSTRLGINSLTPFTLSNLPSPPVFSIPATDESISITIASCSIDVAFSSTRFFLSNESSIPDPGPDDLEDPGVREIALNSTGVGEWTGPLTQGGFLSVSIGGPSGQQQSFEVAVSSTGPTHTSGASLPLLGDTTSNIALLFSPPFAPPPRIQPTYPNYTLPAANLTFPPEPTDPPNYQLFIAPTSALSSAGIPRTGCALRAAAGGAGTEMRLLSSEQSEGMWLRDEAEGWRWQWLVQGLAPSTNYTAFAVLDGTKVSDEIMFSTKSGGFACPLVHSLPYCPRTAYAIPMDPPPAPGIAHDASTLPATLTDPLLSYLTNFTTSLLTHPCGRDLYSPLVTCSDCQEAYRKWLCTVSFPRCGEPRPDDPSVAGNTPTTNSRRYSPSFLNSFRSFASFSNTNTQPQQPLSALLPQSTTTPPRNQFWPSFTSPYSVLLPCLETCTAVDRACPVMLGFKCPIPRFTASLSYGVGFVDSGEEGEESQGKGIVGTASDQWGNVWCNAG
ncbi:stretch-activated Ca2+-permeable channel component-domain-containing protein [Cristinia sonorae]|uniref:Stretch-activated Ca2+-permeable channel component-domain-containing protein n=1 Tax=Cristinia sonorae TaxID=1940300 RepID=A0A8K0UH83_9AGAR|nr:stretch-activated Ca2+-permeable channel component-domain-containing protein [Cristinia sonorae]